MLVRHDADGKKYLYDLLAIKKETSSPLECNCTVKTHLFSHSLQVIRIFVNREKGRKKVIDYSQMLEYTNYCKAVSYTHLDAKKDAKLVYGLYHDVSKGQLRKSIENGTVEKYLQKVPVKKNDLFYIEAGTIHAIGAGVLAAG